MHLTAYVGASVAPLTFSEPRVSVTADVDSSGALWAPPDVLTSVSELRAASHLTWERQQLMKPVTTESASYRIDVPPVFTVHL